MVGEKFLSLYITTVLTTMIIAILGLGIGPPQS